MLHRELGHEADTFPEFSSSQPRAFYSTFGHRLGKLPFIDDAFGILSGPAFEGAVESASWNPG